MKKIDRGFRRLEPVDWVFGVFRAASVLIISIWVIFHPALTETARAGLAALASYFALYSLVFAFIGVTRTSSIRFVYHMAMVFDIVFLGAVIDVTGGINSSLFFLGFFLLVPLHTLYFGFRVGALAYFLSLAVYIVPHFKDLTGVTIMEVFLKIGVLAGVYATSGFLRLRQEMAKERLSRLNAEVEKKSKLLAVKSASERSRLFELYTLNKVGKMIAGALDTRELFNQVLKQVGTELHFQHFCLWLYDEATKSYVAKAVEGIPKEAVNEVTVTADSPVEGACLRENRPCLFTNLKDIRNYDFLGGYMQDAVAAICVPVFVRGNRAGMISAYTKHEESFGQDRLEVLCAVGEQISVALQNSSLYNQMRYLSMQDGLTHLYNRRFFDEQLEVECEKAVEGRGGFALLLVDIDHFKQINDELGHLAGDEVLKSVAQTLMKSTRQTDFVCRYGGEEFAIILHNTSINAGLSRGEVLRKAVESEVKVHPEGGEARYVTISAGVSVYTHGATPEEVIDRADRGLYQAKESGRNRVCAVQASFED